MVRPGKLKTRKSTLGASKDERISSAMESLASRSVFGSNKGRSKGHATNSYQRTPDARRMQRMIVEQRDEDVPTSITMGQHTLSRFPPLSTTSCSITTSSSFLREPPPSHVADFANGDVRRSSPRRASERASRPTSRPASRLAHTRSATRPMPVPKSRSKSPSLASFTSPSIKSRPKKEYAERVELVSMKNMDNQDFVRILVSKTSYKPRKDDGTEVVARAIRRANRNSTNGKYNDEESLATKKTTTSSKSMPPILQTMDTTKLQLFCGLDQLVNMCPGQAMGPSQPESKRLRNNKSKAMNAFMNSRLAIRGSYADALEDEIAESNYYGIHSLKNQSFQSASKRKVFTFKKPDVASAGIEKKEQAKKEKKEKKERKIQKRLDKKAKKQIKKELFKELKLNDSFNSSVLKKVTHVNKPFSVEDDDECSVFNSLGSSSSSSDGIMEKMISPWSNEGRIPANVSFVSSAEGDKEETRDRYDIATVQSNDDFHSRDTTTSILATVEGDEGKTMIGVMSGIGNALGFGKRKEQDVRDLRMLDSDISSSADENDDDTSSESSSGYYYTLR